MEGDFIPRTISFFLGRGILPPKLDKNHNDTNEKLYSIEDQHIGHAAHVQASVICLSLRQSVM